MDINSWKNLSESERTEILFDANKFNPDAEESYKLVRALGQELANSSKCNSKKVGVLNRFGELIIHLHVPKGSEIEKTK